MRGKEPEFLPPAALNGFNHAVKSLNVVAKKSVGADEQKILVIDTVWLVAVCSDIQLFARHMRELDGDTAYVPF